MPIFMHNILGQRDNALSKIITEIVRVYRATT